MTHLFKGTNDAAPVGDLAAYLTKEREEVDSKTSKSQNLRSSSMAAANATALSGGTAGSAVEN